MCVNGEQVQPFLNISKGRLRHWKEEKYISYKFPKKGKYGIKISFNKTLTDMKYLFFDCPNLISINFTQYFNTSQVLSMRSMFHNCDNLIYINLYSFNTSLVGDMN